MKALRSNGLARVILFFAYIIVSSLSLSAANYVFHGNKSGDLLDIENWYSVSGTPDIWGIPFNQTKNWTFSDATSLPETGSISGIGRYYDANKVEKNADTNLYVGVSHSFGNIIFSEGGGRFATIWLGSAGHQNEDFTLTMAYYGSGSYQNTNNNIYVSSTASQKSYTLNITGNVYLTRDSHNWGEFDTKAFDKIIVNRLDLAFQGVYLNTYAKSYHIKSDVDLNRSIDSKNNTEPSNIWTVYVPENSLEAGTPLIQIDGKLIRNITFDLLSKIVFDFNLKDLAEGEYILISANGGYQGFDNADGFELRGIDDSAWSLGWVGNNLMLTSNIPEPAQVGILLGLIILLVTFSGKRKL